MKITYQAAIYFLIIILLMVGGLTLIFNRVAVMNVAHQRLIQEWQELQLILQFIDDIDEVMTTISLAPADEAQNARIDEAIARIASDLELIRLQSLTKESFEEEAHVMTERSDFVEIMGEFRQFLFSLTGLHSDSPTVAWAARQELLEELKELKSAAIRLQAFYMEGMGEASGYAQKLREQILQRIIVMSAVLLVTIGILAGWFIHLINKNARAILQREKGLTIGLMAQSLAHEIRNPLGIIKSSASVIKEKLPAGSEERELSDYLIDESDRISRLLEDLLQLNKERPRHFKPEQPAVIIGEVLALLGSQCAKERVTVNFTDEAPGAVISCEAHQFKQVLINVLLNALHAAAGGGHIGIRSFRKDRVYHVEISDSGRGFTPEALKNVFEPFFTTKNLGSGLGLFVAKNIMESFGGTITVSSAEGRGARVDLSCPVAGE